jgi:phosphomannomutase
MAEHSGLIVSVSGIRGIVGQGLTARTALAFAGALGAHTNGGRIVVGRDGRPSGTMLRHAVLAGLAGAGCEIHDLAVAATPTLGLAVRALEAAGGIQITASHNPAPWNGLKLFGPDGRVLSAAEGRKLKALFESGAERTVPAAEVGVVKHHRQAEEAHADRVLGLVDVPRIRGARLKAFVDGNGGAGGPLARRLLHALNVEPITQGCEADGFFRHEPEPTAENLLDICPLVSQHEADVGFALDPDSDRLALIDETGRYIGEELTLALAVAFRLRKEKGPVVINMSTSRVVEDLANRAGCPCHRTAVGEANVADKMLAVGAIIGGEGNGGVIDPRVGLVRDPFIGMALVLNLMAETGRNLSDLVNALPEYQIVKARRTVSPARLSDLFDAMTAHWPEAKANRLDGLRLDWQDRWAHVRPSNTEPIVRIIAEAPTIGDATALCHAVEALLKE